MLCDVSCITEIVILVDTQRVRIVKLRRRVHDREPHYEPTTDTPDADGAGQHDSCIYDHVHKRDPNVHTKRILRVRTPARLHARNTTNTHNDNTPIGPRPSMLNNNI